MDWRSALALVAGLGASALFLRVPQARPYVMPVLWGMLAVVAAVTLVRRR